MSSDQYPQLYGKVSSGLVLDEKVELLERIGVGAQGQVWRVREIMMPRRECAAKLFIVPSSERTSAYVEKLRVDFINETRNLGILERKRFVINLHYIVEGIMEISQEEVYYLALIMELSELGDLGRLIHSNEFRTMQPFVKIELMRAIAQGLQEAHFYQIFHSDLKPSNVLMFK